MNDNFAAQINQIKANQNFFAVDEANTKNSSIAPILNILGWNIFDITEVRLEYPVENRKIDYSLRLKGQNKVFLEAKKASEDLERHQNQLLDYSFREGVELAILTNGITWWFYLPLERIPWEQRKFFTIDLNEQSIEDCIEKFQSLLSKENIGNGTAYQNAKLLFESGQKNKIIKENLPKAWQKLISEPDEMLVELLNETLEKTYGYKAENFQIVQFLHQTFSNSNANPQVQRALIPEPVVSANTQNNIKTDLIELDVNNLGNLYFTAIIDAKFAGNPAGKWRTLLNIGLKIAFDRGIKREVLQETLKLQFVDGEYRERGFRPVPGTNFSIHGENASKTAAKAVRLARLLNCEIYALFEWGENGRFPSKRGLIQWKP